MNLALFAFIICHGNAGFLRRAAESLAAQTRQPTARIILCTDAAKETEAAAQIVSDATGIGVIGLSESLSCAGSKNYAASLVTIDCFFTLDADDYLEPRFVEKCIAHMEKSGADVVGCDYWVQRVDGPRFQADLPPIDGVRQANPLPCCSIIRTAAFRRTSGFPDILYDDWAIWLELTRLGCFLDRVPEPLFTFVRHPGAQAQPEKHEMGMRQLREARLL